MYLGSLSRNAKYIVLLQQLTQSQVSGNYCNLVILTTIFKWNDETIKGYSGYDNLPYCCRSTITNPCRLDVYDEYATFINRFTFNSLNPRLGSSKIQLKEGHFLARLYLQIAQVMQVSCTGYVGHSIIFKSSMTCSCFISVSRGSMSNACFKKVQKATICLYLQFL